jgi:NADPH2:quinone reductase
MGTIKSVGPNCSTPFPVGTRVAYYGSRTGSYAEETAVSVDHLLPLPQTVSDDLGAFIPGTYCVAAALVDEYVPEGTKCVLIQGASGPLGYSVLQLTRAKLGEDATIVATTTRADDLTGILVAAGATSVVDPTAASTTCQAAGGAQVIVEGVGASNVEDDVAAAAEGATLVALGAITGPIDPADERVAALVVASPDLLKVHATPEDFRRRAVAGVTAVTKKEFVVPVGMHANLSDASAVHHAIETRKTLGRCLLLPEHPDEHGWDRAGTMKPGGLTAPRSPAMEARRADKREKRLSGLNVAKRPT